MSKVWNLAAAASLALELRRSRRLRLGILRLRADVRDGRVIFSGGASGEHSLAVDSSSEERVLAHWEGYCEANGAPRPKAGDRVRFRGATGCLYVGEVVGVGPKWVRVRFSYRGARSSAPPSVARVRVGDSELVLL